MKLIQKNIVPIVFIILCTIGFQYSGLSWIFFANDLMTRLARNSFLVISLIIPVLAGMGLNFGIVLCKFFFGNYCLFYNNFLVCLLALRLFVQEIPTFVGITVEWSFFFAFFQVFQRIFGNNRQIECEMLKSNVFYIG